MIDAEGKRVQSGLRPVTRYQTDPTDAEWRVIAPRLPKPCAPMRETPLLRVSRRVFPFIQRIFADSGYAGKKVTTATSIAVEIVRKNPDQIGFAVDPRRWVVERFLA